MKFRLLWVAMALAVVTGARAQVSTAPPDSATIVTPKAVLSVTAVAPGQTVPAAVILKLQPGWHMNANKPTLDYLIPTVVTLTPPKGVTVGPVTYPVPAHVNFSFSPQPLAVYEGDAPVHFTVSVAKGAKPGPVTIQGLLTYQPCNQSTCLAPAKKTFSLTVRVAKPGEKGVAANGAWFQGPQAGAGAATIGSGGQTAPDDQYAGVLAHNGLLAFLVVMFFGGLALNLTPCVYPMIAVTMAIFGARAGDARGKVVSKACVYVLGMATMYTTLGVIAALSGGLFGSALQSVWVQGFIAVFLLALALGMFGVYELQMPASVQAKLGGVNRVGMAGIYFSGLVVGVFAAPCVGPVVLGLLALVGAKHNVGFGAVSFFTLSLGLGAPYIVLASSTSLLSRLPRSGSWLEWIKHLFGVILIAVAAGYIVQIVAKEYTALVVPICLVLGAFYLGFLDHHGGELAKFRASKVALGVLGVAYGLVVGSSALRLIQSRWPLYSDAQLASALQSGKPVVMDFTASWCAQCHELESRTFSDHKVQGALQPFQRLRVEVDGANKSQADALQKKWGVQGLPAVIFVDPSGTEVPNTRVAGFVPPADFLARVSSARPQVARG